MNKASLISKLNKFCPDWLTKPLESDSETEILKNVINQVLPGLLDITIEFMDNSSIIGSVPYKHETANVVGYMHGGTIFSTGDTLAGAYLWAITDEDTYAITTKSDIKYIKPFNHGTLRCIVKEKSRLDKAVTLEAVFKDANDQTISIMNLDYLLISKKS